MSELSGRDRVQQAADQLGVSVEFARRAPASSLEEAAANLGIAPHEIVKTLVARAKLTQTAAEHSYLIALIPGGQHVDWAKLRKLAGMKKLSMAAPEESLAATGYSPGTITPFGAQSHSGNRWPVYADESITGPICMGAGEPDLNLFVQAEELFAAFDVTTGEISKSAA